MTLKALFPFPQFRAFNDAGDPLDGGLLYTWAPGTNTDKATYTDAGGMSSNTNPVTLDSTGAADVWLDGQYQMRLTDANGVQQWLVDNIPGDLEPPASETVAGIVQLATDAETLAGALKTKATHPHGVVYATKIDNQPAITDFAQDDELLIGDQSDSFINKKITIANFEEQLEDDLEPWVNGLIADAGGGGSTVLAGTIVDTAYNAYTSTGALNSFIPDDDTKPQVTEGTEILTASITPKKTTNKLRITASITPPQGVAKRMCAAMFLNGGADAVLSAVNGNGGAGNMIVGPYEYIPGVLTAVTVSVRVGASNPSAQAFNLNLSATGKNLGGTMGCFLIVEEIDPSAGTGGTSSYILLGSGSVDTSVSSGLIDLRTFAANNTYTKLIIELDTIVTTGAGGGAGVLNALFAQQSTANSASNYGISSSGGFNEWGGNFNQAPQRILHTPGGSVDFSDGAGTIVLYNFCKTTRKPPWINSTIIAYKSNVTIASEVAYGNSSQIWGSGGDDSKVTDGLAFTVTNVTKYTFNYKVYGII